MPTNEDPAVFATVSSLSLSRVQGGNALTSLGNRAAHGVGFGIGVIDSKASQLQGDTRSYAALDRSIAGEATNARSRAFWEGAAAGNDYTHR